MAWKDVFIKEKTLRVKNVSTVSGEKIYKSDSQMQSPKT